MIKLKLLLLSVFLLCNVLNTFSLPSYRKAWAGYILSDICLGGSMDYYIGFAKDDPNSSRAVRWYQQGIRPCHLDLMQRKKFGKDVFRIVHAGTNTVIGKEDIILSGDLIFDESKVRIIMAMMNLSGPSPEFVSKMSNPEVAEAFERLKDSVLVTNCNRFALCRLQNENTLVYKGTHIPVGGNQIRLTSDEDFYQDAARYMFADICLGAPISYYEQTYTLSRDPNIFATLNFVRDSIRIVNLDLFERITSANGKVAVVYKGTQKTINGNDVELNTDVTGDAEVRYKMADVALGAPLSFYKADAKNATNKIMFQLLEKDVRVINISDFERNRFSDGGMLVVKKNTRRQITGQEVILSSDLTDSEAPIRYCMALIGFKGDLKDYVKYPHSLILANALQRLKQGEKIVNRDQFDLVDKAGKPEIVFKLTGSNAFGMDMVLNNDTWYNEQEIRRNMAIRLLNEDKTVKSGTPDLNEAQRRLDNRVTVTNLSLFTLKNATLYFKDGLTVASGDQVKLSTDFTDSVFLIKEVMLKCKLGLLKFSDLEKAPENLLYKKALINIKNKIQIRNINTFEVKTLPGMGKTIVYKNTFNPVKSYDIELMNDPVWSEAQVRYIMIDLALGAPISFYEKCVKGNDPIAIEPMRRWNNGIRVVNAEKFKRCLVPELGWKIVYKGTNTPIDPMHVALTTDKKE